MCVCVCIVYTFGSCCRVNECMFVEVYAAFFNVRVHVCVHVVINRLVDVFL